jgi:sulfatase maturation enzyme AslB (radical SAM superfamily)
LEENHINIKKSGNFYTFKLVTNGTLLSNELITVLQSFYIDGVSELFMNISIDGSEATQKKQRPARVGDYSYQKLVTNIHDVLESGIQFEL